MRKAFLEEDFMDVEDLMETTLPPPLHFLSITVV